jgi:hypothetical protein
MCLICNKNNLEKNAENPENFKKLQAIKNLKDAVTTAVSSRQKGLLKKLGME